MNRTPTTASPASPPRTHAAALAAVALLALLAAFALDWWAHRTLVYTSVYERDWGRMLRILGFLPTWLLVALAFTLRDRGNPARRRWYFRGAVLALAPTAAGLVEELMKMLFRRERPHEGIEHYVFRPWSDHPLSTSGLGLPSSHAVIAFSAAFVLGRFFPESRWLWYGLAAACALTRVLAQAHYLSDVTASAIVGPAVAALCWRWLSPRDATEHTPADWVA